MEKPIHYYLLEIQFVNQNPIKAYQSTGQLKAEKGWHQSQPQWKQKLMMHYTSQ